VAIWDELVADVKHIWTDDVLPELAQYGAWGVAMTKSIVYDIEQAGKQAGAVMKELTGQALTGIFNTIIANAKTVWSGGGTFAEKISRLKDYLLDQVNWGSFEAVAVQIGGATMQSLASGFLSMIAAGVIA
jgi:hypothetical protein